MENLTPKTDNNPKTPEDSSQNKVTNVADDRPSSTNDGISDQGSKAEELNVEQQGDTKANEKDAPELDPDHNDIEN